MVLLYTRIESEIPKTAVQRDEVVIAELSFTADDFELSTPGRALEPLEFSMIMSFAERQLQPRKSALRGWGTRRDRQRLRDLYALEDPRTPRSLSDAVSWPNGLYHLEDERE